MECHHSVTMKGRYYYSHLAGDKTRVSKLSSSRSQEAEGLASEPKLPSTMLTPPPFVLLPLCCFRTIGSGIPG